MKKCNKCKVIKANSKFSRNSNRSGGLQVYCKACMSTYKYKNKPEYIAKGKARMKRFKKKNWYRWKAQRLKGNWRSRARKHEIDPDVVPLYPEIEQWLKDQEPYFCYLSGKKLTRSTLEIDHKVPTSWEGDFSLSNLAICSSEMNRAKGAMSEEQFRSLLSLVLTWEDGGNYILGRLRAAANVFKR